MKKITAILGLVLMPLAVQARAGSDDATDLANQIISEIKSERADRQASRANPKNYYEGKLALCLFEKGLENALSAQKNSVDLNKCSGVISQALERGDLNESGIREVIDSLSRKRLSHEAEGAARAERQKQIQQRTKELVEYGNRILN
ncbi:MAG: hypothetical protein RJB38_1355 [Pseudomonadota bacterium]|jgi:polyhydroxyalkanoate synthesis regulator phasin